ncbi:MAG: 4'-phosphopantetheinyl transferase family protein [Armatimonadota bacterium]
MAELFLLHTAEWRVHVNAMQQILSDLERSEIIRFRRDDDQVRSSISRAAVRWLLSERIGVHPSDLEILRNNYGKPYLPQHRIWFNASHSGELVAIALSSEGPVGVDVEAIRGQHSGMDIARRFFSSEECARLQCVPADHFASTFTRIWTGKEALVKASGCGIGHGLENAVLDDDWQPLHQDYQLTWSEPAEGYLCAVASQPGEKITDRLWLQPCQWPEGWPTQAQS